MVWSLKVGRLGKWPACLALLGCLLLNSCGFGGGPLNHAYAPVEQRSFCKMAVLPFINETEYPEGDIIVYRIFTSELVNFDSYRLTQEGDIRKIFQQMEIYPNQPPSYEQIRSMGDRLGVGIVVTGKIVTMSDGDPGRGELPSLALSLKVFDTRAGTTLWTTYFHRTGDQYRKVMHFGLVNTINALAQRMSQEILNSWLTVGFNRCTES